LQSISNLSEAVGTLFSILETGRVMIAVGEWDILKKISEQN